MPLLIIIIVALIVTLIVRESYWSNKVAQLRNEPVKIRQVHVNFEQIKHESIIPEKDIQSMPQEVIVKQAKAALYKQLDYFIDTKFEKDVNPQNWKLTLKLLVGTRD